MKTSKQIKQELQKYSDFAQAYGDAIDALVAWEKVGRRLAEYLGGKVVEKRIAHNEINNLSHFSGLAKKVHFPRKK